jgi:hypothetical protein
MFRRTALCSLVVIASLSIRAYAADLFGIDVVGATNTVKSSNSSVVNMITDLSNNAAQFTPFANQAYTATVNYAGIPAAMKVTQSFDGAGNRIVNVSVPSVGVNQTFSSANGSITTQIRDYLKKDGLAELGAFQKQVDQTSVAGVVDGNPMSTTALLTEAGYNMFALHAHPGGGSGGLISQGGHGETWIEGEGGAIDAGGNSGTYAQLTFGMEHHFNDVIGLGIAAPFRWVNLSGSEYYMGGLIVGLPIGLIRAKDQNGFSWQVTPAGHAGAVGSVDLASGGVVYGGQVDSSMNYTIHGWTFTLANNASYYHGANFEVAGYHFDTDADQWLFANGLQLTKSWDHFFIDASGTWNNYLHSAYVDGWVTPQLGLGFKFGEENTSGIRVSYVGNFGEHYNTNGGMVTLYIVN